LSEHRLPPEICDSTSEWNSSRKATGATAAWTPTALWPASALGAGGDLGSRGVSLVSKAEGLATELDARIRKRYRITPPMEKQLLGISARQIDRRLRAKKSERKRRIYGRTKPGSLLKHHIPVKTDSWNVTCPGFSEIDLVAHCGNSGEGEFAHTLNLTDIHSGWT